MSKNNVLNNEEIIIIQNEIDNLENLLFSKDKDSSQNESNFNMNNFTNVYEPEKINNNSFKNDSLSKTENNITYQIQDQILFGNSNNSIENNLNDAKKDNIKNNNAINLNDANINCNNINPDNLKKVMELINLQKEIDLLREKREKKIIYKTKKLNKIRSNNNKNINIKK